MDLLVFDTETANLNKGVCDFAYVQLDDNLNVIAQGESMIDPECPISPSASGVHGIVDEMVWDQPTMAEFMEMNGNPFDSDDLILCGHNVQFDIRMVSDHLPEQFRAMCTLKLARNLWPDAEDHKLQTLRYKFKLDAGAAHRAMGDVITCVSLLRMIAAENKVGVDGLLELARRPLSLETKINFGKHKGEKLKSIPRSYVNWLLGTENLDPDLREALEQRA